MMMTSTAPTKDALVDLFGQLDRHGPTPLLAAVRQSARQRFGELALPSSRNEDWRFSRVAALVGQPYVWPSATTEVDARCLPAAVADNAIRLVFVNGRFAPALCRLTQLPGGVAVGSLAQPAPEQQQRLNVFLAQVADYQDQVFTALNTGLLADGAYVVVAEGKLSETPIEINYVTETGAAAIATQPRTLVIAGKGSQATIVERFVGRGAYLTNAVTEVALGEAAIVDHVKVQDESAAARHLANTQILLDGRANFTTHSVSLGASWARNEVRVRFDGEGAEATVNGLYLAGGDQHVDNFTVIDHAKPQCASHELYKGILGGKSHGVFNGKIFVREGAQKTDAKQTNKVLLLSEGATINTKPQLEIFADDVKCTHGATVGQLDANALYYLRSRGIGLKQARDLLTFAFANDVVGRIKLERLRDELERRLTARG